jgi:hypothetical protein
MRYQLLRDFYNIYFFGSVLLCKIKANDKVLEVGCGSNSLIVKSGMIRIINDVGVDIFKPYIDSHKADGLYKECICGDITKMRFGINQFDVVVCMDVLEHIEKEKAKKLLERMPLWANKVIVTTPNGEVGNGISDNPYQKHISSWNVKDFQYYGYQVHGLSGLKNLRTDNAELKYKTPYLMWAGISLLTQVYTYNKPESAYHLLATIG